MMTPAKTVTFFVVAVLSVSYCAVPAGAGILSLDCVVDCENPDALNWQWGLQENGQDAWVNLSEQFMDEHGGEFNLNLSGEADSDPIVSFEKTVTNTTSTSWIGYSIGLNPLGVATFVGTPTSDTMTLSSQTATFLTFGLPSPIAPGQTVNFYFDVNIPDAGPFNVEIAQSPAIDENVIPEPATILLLGLAALALVAGRKRLV